MECFHRQEWKEVGRGCCSPEGERGRVEINKDELTPNMASLKSTPRIWPSNQLATKKYFNNTPGYVALK